MRYTNGKQVITSDKTDLLCVTRFYDNCAITSLSTICIGTGYNPYYNIYHIYTAINSEGEYISILYIDNESRTVDGITFTKLNYNTEFMNPLFNIPTLASYYTSIDQSDDEQLKDYHNYVITVIGRTMDVLKGGISPAIKRAD